MINTMMIQQYDDNTIILLLVVFMETLSWKKVMTWTLSKIWKKEKEPPLAALSFD